MPGRAAGSPRLLFVLLSNQLSCLSPLKRGREGEEGARSESAATPLAPSQQSEELLLLEESFRGGWEPPGTRAISFYYCISCCVASLCVTLRCFIVGRPLGRSVLALRGFKSALNAG